MVRRERNHMWPEDDQVLVDGSTYILLSPSMGEREDDVVEYGTA